MPDANPTIVVQAIRSIEKHKAVLAFFYPFIATLAAVATTFVVEGTFDATALRIGVAGLLASGLGALGAFVGQPGPVEIATFPVDNTPGLDHNPGDIA